MNALSRMYQNRFSDREIAAKTRLWRVLCRVFFQRHVPVKSSILDLGSGYCEFINQIRADRKYAVDLNPESGKFAGPGVRFFRADVERMGMFRKNSLDRVFTSNFFEHMPDKKKLSSVLAEVHRILKPGGRLLILQPNIKYLYDAYWDFYDHHTPLSHLSLREALELEGFQVETCIPRFLPYTTKSALPQFDFLVRLYLRLPFVWRFFGKQMFIVALKPASAGGKRSERNGA